MSLSRARMEVRLTHIGGPTVLIEVGGWRLLTDPTFDPPGQSYRFGWGTGSRKLTGPAIAASDLGPIDAVLLSHDHHDDNLDAAGRALLPSAGAIVTTVPGAKRLGGDAHGLEPWTATRLEAPGRPSIEITATPCRHGPPLCDDREPSPASDTEAEENDVPGHVRREHVAQSEVADGVDDAGGEGQHQQRPGPWMLDAAGGAPQRFRVEPRLGGAGRL